MAELAPFIVAMVAAGYLLRKLGLVRGEASRDLNQIVFFVTLPPLIFLALHRGTLAWQMLAMPAVAWGTMIAGIAMAWALARLLRLDGPRTGAFILAATFGNTTFFGYPIIRALYGEGHLTLAIFYDLLGATIAANVLGVAVAAHYGRGGGIGPAGILARLMRFPPIWALLLGVALRGVRLPPEALRLLDGIGRLTVPLIMLSIGLSLRFRHWRSDLGSVALASGLRLVVVPALVLAAVTLLDLPLDYRQTAVLQAAMPTMLYSFTLAMLFGLEVNLVLNTVMVTTTLAFLTLPAWHRILG